MRSCMSCEARYRMPLSAKKQRKLSVIDSSLTGKDRACACGVISGNPSTVLYIAILYRTVQSVYECEMVTTQSTLGAG
jgi:hypothetical protein